MLTMPSLLAILCLLGVSAVALAQDCPLTSATDSSDNCKGSCPDAVGSACPAAKKAVLYNDVEYVFPENVSACDASFPSGCADRRATCECPGGLGPRARTLPPRRAPWSATSGRTMPSSPRGAAGTGRPPAPTTETGWISSAEDANEVKRWGPSVLDFLRRYGVK